MNHSSVPDSTLDSEDKLYNLDQVLINGWLLKRSRYMLEWRKRWVVLTSSHLLVFKTNEKDSSKSEILPIDSFVKISCTPEYMHKFGF